VGHSKAALGRLAEEVRAELELRPEEPFDPLAWAQLYGVPFLSLIDIAVSDAAVQRFTRERTEIWSAALLRDGTGHVVVYNPAHSPERTRSNLAHEVAHFVAEHTMSDSWFNDEGSCGVGGASQEAEAAELAGALLVPTHRAKQHAIRGGSPRVLASQYSVSLQMAEWRMRMSGGYLIARRSRSKRAFL
jgi:Zn-dependent peptidase ImmA (M78 family)